MDPDSSDPIFPPRRGGDPHVGDLHVGDLHVGDLHAAARGTWSGWTWLLVGLLAVTGTREALERPPLPPRVPMAELALRPTDLRRAGVRALRRLPGIGNHRAVQLVRARRTHEPDSGPLRLEDLPGIGPKTGERVGRALSALEPWPPPVRPASELVLAGTDEAPP